eukprot:PhM_4_TR8595/c0_g1_i1/m.86569
MNHVPLFQRQHHPQKPRGNVVDYAIGGSAFTVDVQNVEAIATFSTLAAGRSITSASDTLPLPVLAKIGGYLSQPFAHVGSWGGCGGNPSGVAHGQGNGNCSSLCKECGAGTHWTCCGDNHHNSTMCLAPTRARALTNANNCFSGSDKEQNLTPTHLIAADKVNEQNCLLS